MPPIPNGSPAEPRRRRRRSEAAGFPSEQDEQDSWSAFGSPVSAEATDGAAGPSYGAPGYGGEAPGSYGDPRPAPRPRHGAHSAPDQHAGQGGHGGHAADPGDGAMPWWARRGRPGEENPWLPSTPAGGVSGPAGGAQGAAPGWPQPAPEQPWPPAAAAPEPAARRRRPDEDAGRSRHGRPAEDPWPGQSQWPGQGDWSTQSGPVRGGPVQSEWSPSVVEPTGGWPAAEPSWPSTEPAWGSDQSWSAPPEPSWPSGAGDASGSWQPETDRSPARQPEPQEQSRIPEDPAIWTPSGSWSAISPVPPASSVPASGALPAVPPVTAGTGLSGAGLSGAGLSGAGLSAAQARSVAPVLPASEVSVGWPADTGEVPHQSPAETGPIDLTAGAAAAPAGAPAAEPQLKLLRFADPTPSAVPAPTPTGAAATVPGLIPATGETSMIDLDRASATRRDAATDDGEDTSLFDVPASFRDPDPDTSAVRSAPETQPQTPGSGTTVLPWEEDTPARPPRRRRQPVTEEPAPRGGRNLPAAIGMSLLLGGGVAASLLFRKEIFIAVAAAAVILAIWELAGALSVKRIAIPVIPLGVGAVGMLVSAYVAGQEGLIVSFTLTAFGVVLWRVIDGLQGAVRDIAGSVFTAAYVPLLAAFAILMLAPDDGPMRVITFFLVVFASDTGGYLAGVMFGKHPMAPTVSPKKSWEGFAGSTIGCLVAGAVAVPQLLGGGVAAGLALGAATVVVATMGDLGESLIKRDLRIKDMSSILPGHGGMMDRMDSLLATAPVAFLLLNWLVPVAV